MGNGVEVGVTVIEGTDVRVGLIVGLNVEVLEITMGVDEDVRKGKVGNLVGVAMANSLGLIWQAIRDIRMIKKPIIAPTLFAILIFQEN